MRGLVLAAALLGAPPVLAQSLDANLGGSLSTGIASGLNANVASGLVGTLGQTQQGRTQAQLEERGFTGIGICAPTQIDLNNTGCRSLREFGVGFQPSTYDQSVQAMRPLTDTVLQNLILEPTGGPPGPLD